ncbi:unnamed protein product, partial [Owenia fusiformis]
CSIRMAFRVSFKIMILCWIAVFVLTIYIHNGHLHKFDSKNIEHKSPKLLESKNQEAAGSKSFNLKTIDDGESSKAFDEPTERNDIDKDDNVKKALMSNAEDINSIPNKEYLMTEDTQLQRRFPKAMIIGMAKCGTNAIQRSLELNPLLKSTSDEEVCLTFRKENFTLDSYRERLPLTLEQQVTITKCPQLLDNVWNIKALHDHFPEMKLIISLCDPVKQAVSSYVMHYEIKRERNLWPNLPPLDLLVFKSDGTVNEYSKYIRIYIDMLKPVFTLFPMEQILIIDGENFIKDPVMELSRVEDFLQVPRIISRDMFLFNATKGLFNGFTFLDGHTYHLKAGKGHPHPTYDQHFYDKLHTFYEPYNKKLFAKIGRTFNWNYNGKKVKV